MSFFSDFKALWYVWLFVILKISLSSVMICMSTTYSLTQKKNWTQSYKYFRKIPKFLGYYSNKYYHSYPHWISSVISKTYLNACLLIIFFFQIRIYPILCSILTFSKHYYIVEQFHEKKLSLKHRTEQNISSLIVVVNSKSFQKQAHKTENILLIFFHIRLNYMDKNTSVQCTEQFHEKKNWTV